MLSTTDTIRLTPAVAGRLQGWGCPGVQQICHLSLFAV